MPRARRSFRAVLAAAALAAATAAVAGVSTDPAAAAVPGSPRPDWGTVSSWGINNAYFDASGIAPIRGSVRDMVVIGRHNGHTGQEWRRDEIEAGKLSKWLLAYLAVGEAQRSEWYWDPAWDAAPPAWVIGQNPYWANNVYTELASPEWQAIVTATVDRIIDQGFDGAFLDVVDAYWYPGYPDGPTWYNKLEGAQTVCAIARHARARNPEFKLVVNNALDLFWMLPGYMDCIDGTVIEGLWWFDSNQPRDDFYRNQKIGELAYHQAAGKKVFALDYAPWWDQARVEAEASTLGYLPYVTRSGQENPLPT
jgi:cysteinyl-tRNA synthetase, unknown class